MPLLLAVTILYDWGGGNNTNKLVHVYYTESIMLEGGTTSRKPDLFPHVLLMLVINN